MEGYTCRPMDSIYIYAVQWPNQIMTTWGAYWSFGNCDKTKIFGLNVKLKNDKSKFSPIMTVKWKEKKFRPRPKCDKVKYNCHGRAPDTIPKYILSIHSIGVLTTHLV